MDSILFIGTTHMDIYKDIIVEMQRQGYKVDFIPEVTHLDDPDNIRGYKGLNRILHSYCSFEKKNEMYWRELLSSKEYRKNYDILFVLDGQSIHKCVFDILRKRNPKLYAVNYLFDTTKCVYHFEHNFSQFDRIATFDMAESKQYGILHLPIFWVEAKECPVVKYKFFGLGRIDMKRYRMFAFFNEIASLFEVSSFIKLQCDKISFFDLKYFIRKLIGKVDLTPTAYYSELCTQKSLTPSEFRNTIMESEVIIDTAPKFQDGMTARFMWALGAKRKIITTNEFALDCDFFSPSQVLIVNSDKLEESKGKIVDFINRSFDISPDKVLEIEKCRIDNWLTTLLER